MVLAIEVVRFCSIGTMAVLRLLPTINYNYFVCPPILAMCSNSDADQKVSILTQLYDIDDNLILNLIN